jgi:carbon monoxide dehydrogenase subunit G
MSMELDNSFTVPVSPDRAWDVLLDVERIAPCMPGATVDEFDGEVVTGRIKVKVGPVSLTYRGTAKFTERDPAAHLVVVEASGKEMRGSGTASATVRASLEPGDADDSTQVSIHTTMNVTGRPAQFGRGVIAEVGGKLVDQFAQNLAKQITEDSAPKDSATKDGATEDSATKDGAPEDSAPQAATPDTETPVSGPGSTVPSPVISTPPAPAAQDQESLNLVRLVGPAVLKRVVPVAAAVAGIALLATRLRKVLRRGKV